MSLVGVFYSEFDNTVGPQIVYQAPENAVAPETFDAVSDYVITDKDLCGSLLTVNAFGRRILSYPLCVEHARYERSRLLFALSFVFRRRERATRRVAAARGCPRTSGRGTWRPRPGAPQTSSERDETMGAPSTCGL